ncbi:MAG TPA: type II secretion system F family protein [Aestuariivirgaceae bacterium]|nr:type II secretion system F family protein [Aestuariivirgaceae bacterium]
MMAALSASSALLVVFWPYLAPDTLGTRMRVMVTERDRIRVRERTRMNGSKNKNQKWQSLRPEPKKFFQQIVNRFNLAKDAEDGEMALMLRRAGYRGHGPVVTFLAVRLIAPLAMLAIASLAVFLVLTLEQPLAVKLGIVLVATAAGYYAPLLYVRSKIGKRQKAIRRAWPDALDLLLICVESGMSIEAALLRVSGEIGAQSVELAEELSLTTAEMSYLQDRRKAYENLGTRTGVENVRSVVTSLIQAEKYGTPLGQSLRVLAQDGRDERMGAAEKKAAGLPPKLTVPMIIFFLPVLFAVIMGPAGIQIANMP